MSTTVLGPTKRFDSSRHKLSHGVLLLAKTTAPRVEKTSGRRHYRLPTAKRREPLCQPHTAGRGRSFSRVKVSDVVTAFIQGALRVRRRHERSGLAKQAALNPSAPPPRTFTREILGRAKGKEHDRNSVRQANAKGCSVTSTASHPRRSAS